MGWAAEQAAKITEAESKLQKTHEWQLHVAQLIKTQGLIVFNLQADRIEHHVKEFNSAHGNPVLTVKRGPKEISIVKECSPFVSLRLRHEEHIVSAQLKHVHNYHLQETAWDIWYRVNPDGTAVFLGSEDFDQEARGFVDTVLNSYFGTTQ